MLRAQASSAMSRLGTSNFREKEKSFNTQELSGAGEKRDLPVER